MGLFEDIGALFSPSAQNRIEVDPAVQSQYNTAKQTVDQVLSNYDSWSIAVVGGAILDAAAQSLASDRYKSLQARELEIDARWHAALDNADLATAHQALSDMLALAGDVRQNPLSGNLASDAAGAATKPILTGLGVGAGVGVVVLIVLFVLWVRR